MAELANLRNAAREIFATALHSVDAGEAVRRAVRLDGARLTVADTTLDLASHGSRVYAVAIGKAAPAMAAALDDILGNSITSAVITGPAIQQHQDGIARSLPPRRWQFFAGGHPLPNQDSLNAAQACFDLLQRAEAERAIVLFLISGGGSAMLEWPIDNQITLAELSEANRLLVSCGASIAEINAVRRAISAVKGGRLAAQAPNAAQVTLIISDTNSGDEASVASGPTVAAAADAQDARVIVGGYETLAKLPFSILKAINDQRPRVQEGRQEIRPRQHYVLLDNHTAIEAAAQTARRFGLLTEIAFDVVEPKIEAGCPLLLSRLETLRSQNNGTQAAVCLISGGEFLCPVRGNGVGGRNAETVLRCAIEIDNQDGQLGDARSIVILSAGTDGIDGNSPAAGAIADTTTLKRARALNLDARSFLEASDAFSFFNKLGDTVSTGATGTNVRDLRILLAR